MSVPTKRPLYLATLTIRVPLAIDPDTKIGGEAMTPDQVAAWDAMIALGLCSGRDVRERIEEGGFDSIVGLDGEVTRLERLVTDRDIEPDWHRATEGRRP